MGIGKDIKDELKAKRISIKYDIPMVTARCYVSNGGGPSFVCDHCKHQNECIEIQKKESKDNKKK